MTARARQADDKHPVCSSALQETPRWALLARHRKRVRPATATAEAAQRKESGRDRKQRGTGGGPITPRPMTENVSHSWHFQWEREGTSTSN